MATIDVSFDTKRDRLIVSTGDGSTWCEEAGAGGGWIHVDSQHMDHSPPKITGLFLDGLYEVDFPALESVAIRLVVPTKMIDEPTNRLHAAFPAWALGPNVFSLACEVLAVLRDFPTAEAAGARVEERADLPQVDGTEESDDTRSLSFDFIDDFSPEIAGEILRSKPEIKRLVMEQLSPGGLKTVSVPDTDLIEAMRPTPEIDLGLL